MCHTVYDFRNFIYPVPTLVYRRERGDMIEVFKILHGYHESVPEGVPYLKPSSYTST